MTWFGKTRNIEAIPLRRWLRLNALLLGLVLVLSMTSPVTTLNLKLSDVYFRMRPAQPVSSSVALVMIDDATLARVGRWPWPRQRLAQLIRAVTAQHPLAIGLDVLLPESEDERNDAELALVVAHQRSIVGKNRVNLAVDTSFDLIGGLRVFLGRRLRRGLFYS